MSSQAIIDIKEYAKEKLSRPSEKVANFLISENKTNKTILKLWEKEFTDYMRNILFLVYGTDTKTIDMILENPIFFKMLKRGFTDETESADSYEALEFVGDELYNQAFKVYIFKLYKGNISPFMASALKQRYVSNAFMEIMANRLKMSDWVILGGPTIVLNQKIRANMIESFCGAIYIINTGLKNIFIKKEEWKKAAMMPLNPVQIFVNNYFSSIPPSEREGSLSFAKGILKNALPDSFGSRGAIRFLNIGGHKTVFKIDKTFAENVAENVAGSSYKINYEVKENKFSKDEILRVLLKFNNREEDVDNENVLAAEILDEYSKLGITQDLIDAYANFSRTETLPEPYRSQMKAIKDGMKKKDREHNYNFRFEEPSTYVDVKKGTKTVILYLVKGDVRHGRTIERTKLEHFTGEDTSQDTSFSNNLRIEVVKKYLSKIK